MQELLSIEWASSSGKRRYCFPRKTKLENAKLINEMRKYYMKTKVTDLFFYFWGVGNLFRQSLQYPELQTEMEFQIISRYLCWGEDGVGTLHSLDGRFLINQTSWRVMTSPEFGSGLGS